MQDNVGSKHSGCASRLLQCKVRMYSSIHCIYLLRVQGGPTFVDLYSIDRRLPFGVMQQIDHVMCHGLMCKVLNWLDFVSLYLWMFRNDQICKPRGHQGRIEMPKLVQDRGNQSLACSIWLHYAMTRTSRLNQSRRQERSNFPSCPILSIKLQNGDSIGEENPKNKPRHEVIWSHKT
jgi:hypothetical protein